MKKLILLAFLCFSIKSFSQNLETVYLNKNISTHFLSKVNIDKIDLSTNNVVGQITNKRILAIKPINNDNIELGVLSIIGEDYFVQYRLKYTNDLELAAKRVELSESKDNYFYNPDFEMSNVDMWKYSRLIEKESPKYNNASSKKDKAIIRLNNIIVKDHYIFIDYSIKNKTNLIYDVDDIKYNIDDRKVTKNTNIQRQNVEPKYQYNKNKTFKKTYRNIVCFDKMTFPDNKHFIIELSEKQISGRTIRLSISYLDILNADTL